MRYRIRSFLMLVVIATMLAGCAAGESSIPFTEGLAYDEAKHAWTTEEEAFLKLVRIMQQDCSAPDTRLLPSLSRKHKMSEHYSDKNKPQE